jgi:hypothetical protein
MDSKDTEWFTKTYCPFECRVDHDVRSIDIMSTGQFRQYQMMGGGSTITLKFAQGTLETLIMDAKIGQEELARARVRVDYPNVQAAYDAYITLLALSTKYD